MTSSGATNPTGGGPIQWKSAATSGSDSSARTNRSATFVADGKEYTVTVNYSRQAVMDKYGVDDSGVDTTMEQVISRIGAEQLKNLAGHSISTSLRGVEDQIQYKANTDSNYKIFSDSLQNTNPKLFQTISTVRDVFGLKSESLRSVPTRSGGEPTESSRGLPVRSNDDRTDSDVTFSVDDESRASEREPRSTQSARREDERARVEDEQGRASSSRTGPTLRFTPVADTGPTRIIDATAQFAGKLVEGNPLRDHPNKINTIIMANKSVPANRGVDSQVYDQQKANILEVLNDDELNLDSEQINDVLNQLDNKYFADNIRGELGIIRDEEVISASARDEFTERLLGVNPINDHLDKIDVIIAAIRLVPSNRSDNQILYDQQKAKVIEVLSDTDLSLTPEFKNDVLKQFDNVYFADDIRVELGMESAEDVILDNSQGTIQIKDQPEGVGKFACASICGQALLFLAGNENKIDRDNLASLMVTGIERHTDGERVSEAPPPKSFPDSVFPEIKAAFDNAHYELYDEHVVDIKEDVRNLGEKQYIVFQGQIKGRSDAAKEAFLIYKDDEKWVVFNSHAKDGRGASARYFDSSDQTLEHLERLYDLDANHDTVKVEVHEKAD